MFLSFLTVLIPHNIVCNRDREPVFALCDTSLGFFPPYDDRKKKSVFFSRSKSAICIHRRASFPRYSTFPGIKSP